MWLKSKSIPKLNSSILNVFEPKFSIFAKQQYPSFSTSIQRNVATWGVCDCQYFCGLFFHITSHDQHLETRSVFGPKVNMCHWSFSGNITLKRFAVIAWFLFLTWFPWTVDFFLTLSTIVKRRKKNLQLNLCVWRSKYQCWFVFLLS